MVTERWTWRWELPGKSWSCWATGAEALPGGEYASAGLVPAAIALGKFSSGGNVDASVIDAASGKVRILAGDGKGGLREGVSAQPGLGPSALAVADLDGDGKLDLAVADALSNDISVFLGNGDGTFRDAARYGTGSTPRAILAGDFNGDGKPDLAVANYAAHSVSVLLGTGGGRFEAAVNYAAGDGPSALAAGDFDGDGQPDLAVANVTGGTIGVLTGNGNGTFQAQREYRSGSPTWLLAADMEGNGKTALIAAGEAGNGIASLRSDRENVFMAIKERPQIQFTTPTTLSLASSPNSSTFGAAVTLTATVTPSAAVGYVTFYDGTTVLGSKALSGGKATLSTILLPAGVSVLHAYYAGGVKLSPPVVYTSSTSQSLPQKVNATPATGFSAASGTSFQAGTIAANSIVVGDFNGDGNADLAITGPTGVVNGAGTTVLLGDGSGGFSQAMGSPFDGGAGGSVAVGDFNEDGNSDLAVTWVDFDGYAFVTVLTGNGSGGFTAGTGISLGLGANPTSVAVGDFNGDGHPDLAVAQHDFNSVAVFLGDGNGGFTAATGSPVALEAAPQSVAVGDFNGDGYADLALAENVGGVEVRLGNSSGGFPSAGASAFQPMDFSTSIAVGDFNLHGHPEPAVTGIIDVNKPVVMVFLGDGSATLNGPGGRNGDGGFPTMTSFTAGSVMGLEPQAVTVGDFNGDGDPDLAVVFERTTPTRYCWETEAADSPEVRRRSLR